MYLDKQHPVPVYLQLKEMLRNQIEQGIYFSHQKLPSERDLCQHHNLSRMTARRALQELIDDGLAYTKVGKGTFVSDRPKVRPNGSLKRDEQFPDLVDAFTGEACHTKLIEQLLNFRVVEIEQTLNEILASYSAEIVALKLFPKVIRQLEAQWQRGEISLQTQNYALTTLRCQLTAMVNATTLVAKGPKVLLASAPGDQHEMGLLLLALSLRRRGFAVIYLGPNVPTAEFYQLVEAVQPQLICFSATTTQSARDLAQFSHDLYGRAARSTNDEAKIGQSSLFTFGGVAFTQNPDLISSVSGLYLGHTLELALAKIEQLFG